MNNGIFFKFKIFLLVFVHIFFSIGAQAYAEDLVQENLPPSPQQDYVEDEVLVKYKSSKINLSTPFGRVKASNFISSKSLEKKEDLRKINTSILTITDDKTVEEKVAELKKDPSVEYAQPNFQYYPTDINTDDTHKSLLWGLDNSSDKDIDAPEAWAINEGTNSSVVVAVIDTGVAYNHPDLAANMWDGASCKDENNVALGGCNHGYDYEDNDKTPFPSTSSHGTHIAGTIGAVKNNSKGIIGVAPNVKIMAIKTSLTTSEIIKGINFAKQNGAKIINASWGGPNNDQFLKDAIALFPGLFISAAGNGGGDGVGDNNENSHNYPSDYDLANIISVAATDENDVLATFSNYGATSIDVAAPGTNIYSSVQGTSSAHNETFESITTPALPSGWITDGTNNKWATADSGSNKALYGQVAGFPYDNSTDSVAASPAINLGAGTSGATFSFKASCDTEYTTIDWRDYMQLEYSADGTLFFPASDPSSGADFLWDEAYIDSLNGDSDPAGGAVFSFQNLSIPNQYLSSNFKFRFRWVTNSSDNNYEGCFVDDISINKFSDGFDEQYDYSNGTSMAAPHVVGLAALILGYKPELTYAQVKDAILNTGDSVPSLAGKTVSGKRINAFNALTSLTPISSAKAITAFDFTTPAVTGVIDEALHTVTLTVPFGTNVSALVPAITISANASMTPLSGAAQNFTNPVTYTVTAEDSSTQAYVVTVTVSTDPDLVILAADKAALVDNSIKGANVDLSNITLALTNPLPASGANGSTITWASSNTAVVSNDGQTINRPAFTAGNTAVTLTATLNKGLITDTKAFALTVLKLPVSTVATITSGAYIVSTGGTASETIINVPFGTAKTDFLSALTKGEDNQVLDSTGITDPVVTGNTLLVTAQDGTTKVTYTVTTSVNPDIAKVTADRDALLEDAIKGSNADLSNITLALTNPLPSLGTVNGSTISWASSNTAVVSNDGQTINRPAFEAGNATVTFTASLSKGSITQTKDFTLIVTKLSDTTVPTGSISNITADSYLKGTVVLNATASDLGSGLAKVEFWYGSIATKIGEDTTAPYSLDWNTALVPEGSHSLFVIVYDNAGNFSQSTSVAITVDNTATTVTKLGNNSTDLVLSIGTTDLIFSEVLSNTSKTAVQNTLTLGADKTLAYSWTGATLTITATETTSFANDVIANVSDLAGNTAELLLVDSSLTSSQTTPNGSGASTADSTTPQVVVINPTQAVTVTISNGTSNPTIDLGSFINGGSGTIPAISINSILANISIPASTTVTSADSGWNGIIAAPTLASVSIPEASGETRTLGMAIEIGFSGAKVSFDRGVRLLLPGQAGKRAGYVLPGSAFTEITAACAADNQSIGDSLVANGECKISIGSDLIIWTKHFTAFATFSSVTNVVSNNNGGSNGGSGGGGGGGGSDSSSSSSSSGSSSTSTSTVVAKKVTQAVAVELQSVEIADPFTDTLGHWAFTFVENLRLKGFISGKSKGKFEPDSKITRAELVKIVVNLNGIIVPSIVSEKSFIDVKTSEWYAPYIAAAKAVGVIDGYKDGTFKPDQEISRTEALKILLEASRKDLTAKASSFTDTKPSEWYAPYINYAKFMGLIDGYKDGTFGPNRSITRAEFAKLASLI